MAKDFYFAWVEKDTAFDPTVHNVEDEDVFSHDFSHEEGGFAGLSVVIKNPRVGLLNPGRKTYCYYSFNQANEGDDPDIVPLFYGRLIGLPDNIFDTLITLVFIARPTDFVAQKTALASTMMILPWWDPIFISPDSWTDPDTVLEARSALWHIDPVSHIVTYSDIMIAEDGVVDLPANDLFYDSMQLTSESVPLRSVTMQATIPWTQQAQGTIDFTAKIREAFGGGGQLVGSFTMQGLISSWPQSGAKIGNGWDVIDGSLTDVSFLSKPSIAIPDVFDQGNLPNLAEGSVVFPLKGSGKYWGGVDGGGYSIDWELVGAAKGWAVPVLTAQYTASREFAQIITFTLRSDQQSLATEADDDEAMVISLTANKVSDPTSNGSIPIGTVMSRDYAHTPRGLKTIEHLLLVARANLISRSRAVKLTFQTTFQDMLQYTLRKAGLVHDERLPGGQALGKVIAIHHALDGDTGEPVAQIVIACAIGYGGSYTPQPGTPTYVDEGYVDREYQEYDSDIVLTGTSDIQWYLNQSGTFDDGRDFTGGLSANNVIEQLFVTNKADAQAAAVLATSGSDQAAISSALQLVPTTVTIQLVPMEGGPFTQVVTVQTSDLIIPQQINLEAPSV